MLQRSIPYQRVDSISHWKIIQLKKPSARKARPTDVVALNGSKSRCFALWIFIKRQMNSQYSDVNNFTIINQYSVQVFDFVL